MSVCAYFSKLKDLWDEFEALVPAPNCECDKSKDFVVHLQKLKLFQFLMGLNESYLQARSQILLMSPLPSVNQAYTMIVSEESHKAVATSAGVLGVRPGAQLREENCWKLIGYPPDFKTKRKQRIESGAAYNVVAGQSGEQCSQVKARTYDQEDSEVQMSMISQIGKAAFTQEQYNQILKMIHTGSISTQETEAADVANVAGISSVFLACSKSQQWIMDTGATHHIVSKLRMLDESSGVISEKVKRVCLPNGDTTVVANVGKSYLPEGNNISNVLHTPQFNYNLLSVSKDLYTGKVRAIGRVNGGLYFLADQSAKKATSCGDNEVLTANTVEKKQAEVDLWHRRLGHVSSNVLKRILSVEKLPSSVIHYHTPYERLYGKKPNCDHLRVVGCLCYAKVVNEHDKLLSRTKSTVLMGFSDTQKGYVLYDMQYKLANITISGESVEVVSDIRSKISDTTSSQGAVLDGQHEQHEVTQDDTTSSQRVQDQRKSTRERKTPVWMTDFVSLNIHQEVPYALSKYVSYGRLSKEYMAYIAASSSVTEPTTYLEASKDPRWIQAMKEEIEALNQNHTWDVVSLPKGKKSIGCRWVYKVKYKASVEVESLKLG
ncbi:uncharacterized protein LOC125855737 [Solanum stenotomum]|uniref:uncharacterized protein LOC125855737 n=1 Tax=Solanum stenotomum TaxID=172797 RepID=UPI0020D01658|nr:uncharacterized protein LOC125855737 [Solanum stenotomum]